MSTCRRQNTGLDRHPAKIPMDGLGRKADVCFSSRWGGTVGDIKSSIFFEALRQFQFRVGHKTFCLIFVSLVPLLERRADDKTYTTRVKDLRSLGLSPKVVFCRNGRRLDEGCCKKISSFCHVPVKQVLSVQEVNNLYHVPLSLLEQNLYNIIVKELYFQKKRRSAPRGRH